MLDNIVDKYNNTYHNTFKIKLSNVRSNSYVECNVDSNVKDPKFQVDNHVKISEYKIIFAKGYTPCCSEEVFVINKIKNTLP